MSRDSADEHRERLDELEATVRGLTQELVEANERIRQLEDELEPDDSADPSTNGANRPMPDGHEEETSDEADDTEDPDDLDDIIVA